MTGVRFVVAGRPAPQGSKTRVGRRMIEDNPRTKPWRRAVAGAARQAWNRDPLDVPVELAIEFRFMRPESHYGVKGLRPSAPGFPHRTRGTDVDKLSRAVADAITGIVVTDDVRIVRLVAWKRYADAELAGATIAIRSVLFDERNT